MNDKLTIRECQLIARKLGRNEAEVLRSIDHYIHVAARNPKYRDHFFDDAWWTYNTFDAWCKKELPLSVSTAKRCFARLRRLGILITQLHKDKSKGLWATINYPVLWAEVGGDPHMEGNMTPPECQNDTHLREGSVSDVSDSERYSDAVGARLKERLETQKGDTTPAHTRHAATTDNRSGCQDEALHDASSGSNPSGTRSEMGKGTCPVDRRDWTPLEQVLIEATGATSEGLTANMIAKLNKPVEYVWGGQTVRKSWNELYNTDPDAPRFVKEAICRARHWNPYGRISRDAFIGFLSNVHKDEIHWVGWKRAHSSVPEMIVPTYVHAEAATGAYDW